MPIKKQEKEFVNYLVDLMQSIGPVTAKSMFGGYGLFLNGLMFGLVADSALYFKTGKELENELKLRGSEAFTYNKKGKPIKMSYYQAPEEALENQDDMKVWASKAYNAALQAAEKNPKKK
jgi:DNA transformation protein